MSIAAMTSTIPAIPVPDGLSQLLESQKYSDLTLLCEGHEFKVHKAIVCTQSPVIAAAVDGSLQVGYSQDSKGKVRCLLMLYRSGCQT